MQQNYGKTLVYQKNHQNIFYQSPNYLSHSLITDGAYNV